MNKVSLGSEEIFQDVILVNLLRISNSFKILIILIYLVLIEHLQYARNWDSLDNAGSRDFPRK